MTNKMTKTPVQKLVVFLHGFGLDSNENSPFKQAIIKKFPAWDLISITAPFPSGRERGGYAWFDIDKNTKEFVLNDGKLDESISYLQEQIKKELDERSLSWSNLIVIGRSQGAFLSVLVSSMNKIPCYGVVCTGSIFLKCKQFTLNSRPPIFWFEMEHEKFSEEYIGGYKYLISEGCDLEYAIGENSDHDTISPETAQDIIDKLVSLT